MSSVSWVPQSCTVNNEQYVILGLSREGQQPTERFFYIRDINDSKAEIQLLHVWEIHSKNLNSIRTTYFKKLQDLSGQYIETEQTCLIQPVLDFGEVTFSDVQRRKKKTTQYVGVVLQNISGVSLPVYQQWYGLYRNVDGQTIQTQRLSLLDSLSVFYTIGTALINMQEQQITSQTLSMNSIWMISNGTMDTTFQTHANMQAMLVDTYQLNKGSSHQLWLPSRHVHLSTESKSFQQQESQRVFELATVLVSLWSENGNFWFREGVEKTEGQLLPSLRSVVESIAFQDERDRFDDGGLHTSILYSEVWCKPSERQKICQGLQKVLSDALALNPANRLYDAQSQWSVDGVLTLHKKPITLAWLMKQVRLVSLSRTSEDCLEGFIEEYVFREMNQSFQMFEPAHETFKAITLTLRQIVNSLSDIENMQTFDPQYLYRLRRKESAKGLLKDDWGTDAILLLQTPRSKYQPSVPITVPLDQMKYSFAIFLLEVLGGQWLPDAKENNNISTEYFVVHLKKCQGLWEFVFGERDEELSSFIVQFKERFASSLSKSTSEYCNESFRDYANALLTLFSHQLEKSLSFPKGFDTPAPQPTPQPKIRSPQDTSKKKPVSPVRDLSNLRSQNPTSEPDLEVSETETFELAKYESLEPEDSKDLLLAEQNLLTPKALLVLASALILIVGYIVLFRQDMSFTKIALYPDCDTKTFSCLPCETSDVDCIQDQGRQKLSQLSGLANRYPLREVYSEDAVGICLRLLEQQKFYQLSEDEQTDCLGHVARVENGLSQWWNWWETGYVNMNGEDQLAMQRAIHLECVDPKVACTERYCSFVQQMIRTTQQKPTDRKCLTPPDFEGCVSNAIDYSGMVSLANTQIEWCE